MIRHFLLFCVGVGILIGGSGKAQQILPYRNPTLPVEKRVSDLLARMTLEEKIAQISHLHSWHIFDGQKLNMSKLHEICNGVAYGFFEGFPLTAANCMENFRKIQTYLVENTRHGIPGFSVAESLHGVVHEGATIYPQNIALGCTFNPDLAYQKAKHIAGELNTLGIKQVLAPCIDVVRDLRWGRVEESFGEDPFLCAQMGMAEVRGYMDHGISPMLKHYGPHGNPLGGLNLASVECSVRDLFDIYLKPFEEILGKTHVMAVMSSYNAWDRTPNSASRFMLTDILRNKYGFRGYVYSDWGVIDMLKTFHKTASDDFEAASQVLVAGLDVEASSRCYAILPDEIRQGKFDVENIDRAVRRVLRAKFELGLFENPYQERAAFRLPLRAKESVLLSKQIADESTVLLKNEKDFLPLDINKLKSIAVIGPNADHVQFGDYTWSKKKEDGVTPLQGICRLLENKVKVNYAKGCSVASLDTTGIAGAVETARRSDIAIVFVGSSSTTFVRHSPLTSTSGEGLDLHDITLTGAQEQLIKAVYAVGKPVVVVLVAGKPFAVPWVKKHIPAVLAQWYAGEQEGYSIADILFGRVNPSGRLTFSFPQSTGHLPAYYNYLPTDRGYYKAPGSYENPGRDYVFSSPESLWAFGHGLSYTTFDYLEGFSDKDFYFPHDTIKVTVRLKNSGKRVGKEVVQIYVRDLVSTVMTPVKQLKGFKKVELRPEEIREVTIDIPVRELFLTNEQGDHYLESGDFDIQVGSSSDRIFFHIPIYTGKHSDSPRIEDGWKESGRPHGRSFWIEGSVRDVQATPISRIKVQTESGSEEAFTNTSGYYKLKVKTGDRLIFTKKGFKTKEIEVKNADDVHVQMVKGD